MGSFEFRSFRRFNVLYPIYWTIYTDDQNDRTTVFNSMLHIILLENNYFAIALYYGFD